MSSIKIRNYRPSTDHREVIEICKDVYGGFDALPSAINSYAIQPDTYIYACADEDDDKLHGLICCQLRGHVFYIYGARTRDAFRGKGIAKLLLHNAEAEVARMYPLNQSSITGFLSTTITENAPMRSIFNSHGYVEHCVVDIVSLTAENINYFKEKNMITCSSSTVAAQGATSAVSLQPCTSVEELQLALHALRHRRYSQIESNSTSVSNSTAISNSTVPEWLPGEYVPWPMDSEQVTTFLKERRVFFLLYSETNTTSENKNTTSTPKSVEAVIFIGIGDHGSPFAGIVAASRPSLCAAIHHALELENGLTRLYVDTCEAIDRDYLHQGFNGLELRDYIVVYKPI